MGKNNPPNFYGFEKLVHILLTVSLRNTSLYSILRNRAYLYMYVSARFSSKKILSS